MKKIFLYIMLCQAVSFFFSCKKASFKEVTPIVVAPPLINTKVYYVSAATGNDSRTLNQAKNPATPWKTIQKAANNMVGGDTVIIAGGTYSERVTIPVTCNGTAAAPTVFRGLPGDTVIVDGGNTGSVYDGLISLSGCKFITIKCIKSQNFNWYGFDIENGNDIVIDSCYTYNTFASGIYCNGITNITITNNEVRKACQRPFREPNGNGTQEDITVAGCNNFLISKNEVWDSQVPNTAGGEGIDAKGGSFNGEISHNYVHDIVPLGIYADAGSIEEYNIRVFNNRLERTGGFGVAGELGGHLRDVYIYNNVIKESKGTGFVFQSTGNGKFTNIYVVNNTFYNNCVNTTLTFIGDIANYSNNAENSNLVIKNNIVYNNTPASRYLFTIWHNIPASHVISNNLFFVFKQSNNGVNSFNATNLTAADVITDPLFTNAATGDFTLQATSPAINKGVPIMLPSSTTLLFTKDFNGRERGTADWDMGTFEF
jgi:hypothetical protein